MKTFFSNKYFVSLLWVLSLLLVGLCCGGWFNRQIVDLKWEYKYAWIRWPDGTNEKIEIKKWMDYEQSDMIQVIDKNDKVYLTHSCNVVLISK